MKSKSLEANYLTLQDLNQLCYSQNVKICPVKYQNLSDSLKNSQCTVSAGIVKQTKVVVYIAYDPEVG